MQQFDNAISYLKKSLEFGFKPEKYIEISFYYHNCMKEKKLKTRLSQSIQKLLISIEKFLGSFTFSHF